MKKGKLPDPNTAIALPYGIKNNKLVTIDEVESGLECDCLCPACNNKLIARKGPLVKNYFAHYANADCNKGIEAGMQQLCKDIIAEEKYFALPALFFSYGWRHKILPEKVIKVDAVKLESRSGSPIPDIIIESRGQIILVEITVNQRASWEKMQLLKNKNITGVEIHIPRMAEHLFKRKDFRLYDEAFRKEIIHCTTSKWWIHNPRLTEIEAALKNNHASLKEAKWFKVEYGLYHYVDDCPLKKRVWQSGFKEGRPYATIEDCNRCDFCLSKYEASSGHMYCVGHLGDTFPKVLQKVKAELS